MRKVEVIIGRPEFDVDYVEDRLEHLQIEDTFCVNFVEDCGNEGFLMHCHCLCNLSNVVEAWLMGKAQDEIQAMMTEHDEGSDGHEGNEQNT
jgi:hypothetical protein